MQTDVYMKSYHVFDSRFEVTQEGFGLVSLDLTILDGFSPQEVVHLDSKDGCRAALILSAEITCSRSNTQALHINSSLALLHVSRHPEHPHRAAHLVLDQFSD